MAFSKYPKSLDDSSTLPVSVNNVTPVDAEVVNRLRSSVISTQTELGTTPSGTFGTVKARLDSVDVTLSDLAASIGVGGGDSGSLSGRVTTLETDVTTLESTITSVSATLTSHISNTSNPHSTTAAEVGAPNLVATTTDEALVRFDGTSGQMQNSANGPFATDPGELRLINNANITGRNFGGSAWVPLVGINSSNEVTLGGLGNVDVVLNANNNVAANISNSRVNFNGYIEANNSLGTTVFPSTGSIRVKGGVNNNGFYFRSVSGNDVELIGPDASDNIIIGTNTAGAMGSLYPSVPTGQSMFFRVGGTAQLTLDETDVDVIVPVRLAEQGGDPAFVANTGAIYTKDDAGISELFYIDDAGTVTKITDDGYLAAESILGAIGGTGTDNSIARWDGTSDIQNSSWSIDDSGDLISASSTANPEVYQEDEIVSTSSQNLTIKAQSNTAVGSTGGNLYLQPGSGTTTTGVFQLRDSSGTPRIYNSILNNLEMNGNSSIIFRTAGTYRMEVNNASITLANDVNFVRTITSPTISQSDETVSTSSQNLTISAQNNTAAGSTGGDLYLQPGSGNTNDGIVALRDSAGTNRVWVDAQSNIQMNAASARQYVFAVNGSITMDVFSTALRLRQRLRWYSLTIPRIDQEDDASGTAGDLFTIKSQNVTTSTGSAVTAGGLTISGGDATGSGVGDRTGGPVTITGGDATTASGTLTGGAVTISTGDGGAVGDLTLTHGPTDEVLVANSIGYTLGNDSVVSTVIRSGSNGITLSRLGSTRAVFSSELFNYTGGFTFWNTVTTPVISHRADNTNTVGDLMTINSQDLTTATGTKTAGALLIRAGDCSGGTSNTGGAINIRPGSGATSNGILQLQDGGGSYRFEISAVGNITTNAAASTIFRNNGVYKAQISSTGLNLNDDLFWLANSTASPMLYQADDTTASGTVNADEFLIHAQDTTGAATINNAGDLTLRAGDASNATTNNGGNVRITPGTSNVGANHGNISLMTNASSYQSMARGIFLGDSTAQPSGDPASGGFLFSDGGELKWRGSGGTQTTMAATGGTPRMQVLRYADRVTTTGTATILTIPSADIIVAEEGVINIEAHFTAHDQTENSGAAWTTFAAFRADSSTITEITTESDAHLRQDWTDPWSVDISEDGSGNFDIDVTSDGGSVIFSCWVDVYVAQD